MIREGSASFVEHLPAKGKCVSLFWCVSVPECTDQYERPPKVGRQLVYDFQIIMKTLTPTHD